MALMTQKAYAKKKGVTPQYINKLVTQGKIRLKAGKVDTRQADGAFVSTRLRIDPVKRAAKKASPKKHRKSGRPATDPHAQRTDSAKPLSATRSYAAARAENEYYKAQQSKLLYEQSIGTLLPRAEVLAAERKKNETLRTRLRRLPRNLAPLLGRATSPAEIEQILLGEIDVLLEELAKDPLGQAEELPVMTPPEAVQASAVIPVQESATQ